MDTNPHNETSTSRDRFEERIAALREEIRLLPEEKRFELEQFANATERLHSQMREVTKLALTQLDNLQLGIKYLLFDLEATKRENEELRKGQSGD